MNKSARAKMHCHDQEQNIPRFSSTITMQEHSHYSMQLASLLAGHSVHVAGDVRPSCMHVACMRSHNQYTGGLFHQNVQIMSGNRKRS